MFYNENINSSFNDINLTFLSSVDQANDALTKIYGTGIMKFIKKILCILPMFRSAQQQKINAVFNNCFFKLELVRDRKLLEKNKITLSGKETAAIENLLLKVAKFAKNKKFYELNIFRLACEETLLHKNTPISNGAVNRIHVCHWFEEQAKTLVRDPLAQFLNDPLFDSTVYFKKLRSLPVSERAAYWDDLSNLNIGVSTRYLKKKIIPDIKYSKDKAYLYSLIDEREKLAQKDANWFHAIDQLEIEYSKCKEKQREALQEGKRLWNTLERDLSRYLYLLQNKEIREEFKDWVIRDKQSPHVFFQSRACTRLMKDFSLSEHLATCGDQINLEKNRVPHILQDGKGYVAWHQICWDKIFVANEYIREDIAHIDKEIDSSKQRNLYYMPGRGLTKHDVLNNNLDSIEDIPPFRYEIVDLKEDQDPKADITPIISYDDHKPTIANTHVYVELRIPEGEVYSENGQRKIKMKVYPFGIGHDTKIRNSKRTSFSYFLTKVLPNALKEDPVELFMPDQNEFYRTRKFTKLNQRIQLDQNEFDKIVKVLQSFQKSSQNLEYKGRDRKTFHCSLNNCTQLPTEIYKAINLHPLPKTMPLHHCLDNAVLKYTIKSIHKTAPDFLRKLCMKGINSITGAPKHFAAQDFHINTTWLQRATIGLINENARFAA